MRLALTLALLLTVFFSPARGQGESTEIPDEITTSPKTPWHDFELAPQDEGITTRKVLLWLPNRFLDFIDIFRVDVGVGPSFGAVVRVTKYAQAGYRSFSPAALRIGDFGRTAPVMLEKSNEFGVSPFFSKSQDRQVCPGEIAAGADLFIVGLHAGVCVDQLYDFLTGLFFYDPGSDDLR